MVVTLLGPMVMRWFPRRELPVVNAFNSVAVNTGLAPAGTLTSLMARLKQADDAALRAGGAAIGFDEADPPAAFDRFNWFRKAVTSLPGSW